MKKLMIASMAVITTLAACQKKDSPDTYTVSEYNAVSVDGNVKVKFTDDASKSDTYTVRVVADDVDREDVKVMSQNGVLYIEASNSVLLSDDIVVEVEHGQIEELRLQGGQEAVFSGYFDQDELSIVTGGHSKLTIEDFRIDRLDIKTGGNSEVVLNSFVEAFDVEPTYADARVIYVDNNSLLVDGKYLVVGETVEIVDGVWTVYGADIRSYYIVDNCNITTRGTTMLDASDAACSEVNIDLVGNSEAHIWAIDELSGEGTGSSVLYYYDIDDLNHDAFTTSGSAQIIAL